MYPTSAKQARWRVMRDIICARSDIGVAEVLMLCGSLCGGGAKYTYTFKDVASTHPKSG